jgi:hypothetical protein
MKDRKIQMNFGNVVCHGECGGTFTSKGLATYPNGEFGQVLFNAVPVPDVGVKSIRPCASCLKELQDNERKFIKVWKFFVDTCMEP